MPILGTVPIWSETNRYDLKRFYEYIPEEVLKNKEQEHKFLEEKRVEYPHLQMEDLQIEWITLLCHEELTSQGDIDDHMWLSHGLEMSEMRDEIRIQKNKTPKLSLKEANNLKELSEKSLNHLMEAWTREAGVKTISLGQIERNSEERVGRRQQFCGKHPLWGEAAIFLILFKNFEQNS